MSWTSISLAPRACAQHATNKQQFYQGCVKVFDDDLDTMSKTFSAARGGTDRPPPSQTCGCESFLISALALCMGRHATSCMPPRMCHMSHHQIMASHFKCTSQLVSIDTLYIFSNSGAQIMMLHVWINPDEIHRAHTFSSHEIALRHTYENHSKS